MKKGKNKRKKFLMMNEASTGLYKLKKDAWKWYDKAKKTRGFGLKNIKKEEH